MCVCELRQLHYLKLNDYVPGERFQLRAKRHVPAGRRGARVAGRHGADTQGHEGRGRRRHRPRQTERAVICQPDVTRRLGEQEEEFSETMTTDCRYFTLSIFSLSA